jgi:hypothetical protein
MPQSRICYTQSSNWAHYSQLLCLSTQKYGEDYKIVRQKQKWQKFCKLMHSLLSKVKWRHGHVIGWFWNLRVMPRHRYVAVSLSCLLVSDWRSQRLGKIVSTHPPLARHEVRIMGVFCVDPELFIPHISMTLTCSWWRTTLDTLSSVNLPLSTLFNTCIRAHNLFFCCA